ncbi:MAG: hypothetical protein KDK56_01155 [Simkania sp.]|nr:hypothetical protein [Simkania sp.]MCP5490769.1 hypothetical protein [Chlamydiales bacterium]
MTQNLYYCAATAISLAYIYRNRPSQTCASPSQYKEMDSQKRKEKMEQVTDKISDELYDFFTIGPALLYLTLGCDGMTQGFLAMSYLSTCTVKKLSVDFSIEAYLLTFCIFGSFCVSSTITSTFPAAIPLLFSVLTIHFICKSVFKVLDLFVHSLRYARIERLEKREKEFRSKNLETALTAS